MKTYILLFASLLVSGLAFSQVQNDTLRRSANIGFDRNGNLVSFKPETPPLQQIAGAPKAFYTFYWEFDDGTYSTEKEPKHAYKNKGEYDVKLWATNQYDTGKPPSTRPKKVAVNDITSEAGDIASMDENLDLMINRDPIPQEEMVVVMSYKNANSFVSSGKLYLYYNERQFKADNFELTDSRTYHGERKVSNSGFALNEKIDALDDTYYAAAKNELLQIHTKAIDTTERNNLPLTMEESEAYYKKSEAFEFDDMQPNEERNVFFTMKTTPEMIKDTSAIITVRSIYVPDNNSSKHKVKDLEMEIVTSHDPNKMSSNASLMNYRFVRFKTFKFKIKFQNNGEGPARTIRLETDIPEMFDKQTIEVTDQYPECPICPKNREVAYSCLDTTFTKEQAIFTYKNIYLPGSQQKNVKEYDSTKGFVKYRIKLKKDFHKKKTKSRTAIIFDKNEPIITNYATTRFIPGISLGAKVGYAITPGRDNAKEYFAGVTISPFKSYRGYLQFELFGSYAEFQEFNQFTEQTPVDVFINSYEYFQTATTRNFTGYLVPISYRYNLNNFMAIGTGVQMKLDITNKTITETNGEYSLIIPSEGQVIRDDTQDTFTRTETNCDCVNFRTGIFAGFNIGFARIGPSVGARYIYYLNEDNQQIQLYGIWKF
ncbi:DUF7849 domain-containing protein [Ulvibacter antarcticus]|nr:PKD domain-containing protein [Ulvibacter antarcticus]